MNDNISRIVHGVIWFFLAKDKIDQIRRSAKKTGGGPPEVPPLSPSEEVLIQSLEGRPITCGVSGGIDTDGNDFRIYQPT